MSNKFLSFFKTSAPSEPFQGDEIAQQKHYKKLRFATFFAGTVGYSLYYVARTSLNVVKQPILDSGVLDATQLGIIGSALYSPMPSVNSLMDSLQIIPISNVSWQWD